jgi:DNA-binding response OmpR family regulator
MATVLLVEPDAASAHTYAQSLDRAGFLVETIPSEGARLDLAPDLVVISVPRLTHSLLRVFAYGVSVPRIVLSSDAADAERAAEFACAAVLIRPVMHDVLVLEARRVLKLITAEQLGLGGFTGRFA